MSPIPGGTQAISSPGVLLVPVSCNCRAPYWCKASQGKLWLYGSGTRYPLTDGGQFSSKGPVGVKRCTGLQLSHWTR